MKKDFNSLKIVLLTIFVLLIGMQTPAMAFDLKHMDKQTFLIVFGVALLLPIPVLLIAGKKCDDDEEDDGDEENDEEDDPCVQDPRSPQPKPREIGGHSVSLTGVKGSYSGQQLALSTFPTTLGRDISKCQIMFPTNSQTISRVHCVISNINGSYAIQDLSSNGTWLNGQKLTKGCSVALSNGSEISLADGAEVFRFDC